MTDLKTFLENSTIHGLGHIGSTKKHSRLFWILIVSIGFLGAGILIIMAFDSWASSPVSTLIETLPIAEITFPKVTVCPPKNTYTNLNYDLKYDNNENINDETKNHLIDFAFQLLNDNLYQD